MAADASGQGGSCKSLEAHRVDRPRLMNIAVKKQWVASLDRVTQRYGKAVALDGVSLDFPSEKMIGLIGPDGVGKSTLLGIIAGVRRIQTGKVSVLGGDMVDARFRNL